MEPVQYEFEVFLTVRITRAELEALRTVMERHYDATVKGLSIPGSGAVLNAAANMIGSADAVNMRCSRMQLDLMCKGLEGARAGVETALYWEFKAALKMLDDAIIARGPDAQGVQKAWDIIKKVCGWK